LDAATEEVRGRKTEKARLRAAAIEELRAYATELERFRRSVIKFGELVERSDHIERDWETPVHDALDAVERNWSVDPRAERAAYEELAATVSADLDRHGESSALDWQLGMAAQQGADRVEDQRGVLDERWASARPLIDEALELQTVVYLRSFRHEFRAVTENLVSAIRMHKRDRSKYPKNRVLRQINSVLSAADRWNATLLGVRKDV